MMHGLARTVFSRRAIRAIRAINRVWFAMEPDIGEGFGQRDEGGGIPYGQNAYPRDKQRLSSKYTPDKSNEQLKPYRYSKKWFEGDLRMWRRMTTETLKKLSWEQGKRPKTNFVWKNWKAKVYLLIVYKLRSNRNWSLYRCLNIFCVFNTTTSVRYRYKQDLQTFYTNSFYPKRKTVMYKNNSIKMTSGKISLF